MERFGVAVAAAARERALADYPCEAGGVVVETEGGAVFVPVPNVADDPQNAFRFPGDAYWRHGKVVGVIHSHDTCRHLPWPSAADMAQQIATGVDWGIVATDGERVAGPLWWGDFRLDEPLVGREWRPGITDCYALIRAAVWQRRRIKLIDIPRDPHWWTARGQNLILARFRDVGAIEIAERDAAPGDAVLIGLGHGEPAHLAMIEGGGMILHHAIDQLSRREPFGRWRDRARELRYFRYQG